MLLDRAEDLQKPKIVGRIICALAEGSLPFENAMRLAAMVDRSYTNDLSHLQSFTEGTQSETLQPIVESLFAAGFVSNCGFDGGNAEGGGGVIYRMNEYGLILVRYGLGVA